MNSFAAPYRVEIITSVVDVYQFECFQRYDAKFDQYTVRVVSDGPWRCVVFVVVEETLQQSILVRASFRLCIANT